MGFLGEVRNAITGEGDQGAGPELFGIPAVGPDVIDFLNGEDNDPTYFPGNGSGYTPPFQTTPDDPAGEPADNGLSLTQKAIIGIILFTIASAGVGQLFTFEVGS